MVGFADDEAFLVFFEDAGFDHFGEDAGDGFAAGVGD